MIRYESDSLRTERFHSEDLRENHAADRRTPFEHDRDRVIYSSALRRLASVTQVVDPAEGHVFHNRLTHSLKVAQIARRLAQKLSQEQKDEVRRLGGLDPEVAEAAALIHDLGHPPFGHIAEKALDDILVAEGVAEGYEGNAQSFRIVNSLSIRENKRPGLNLTRATLNAVLKYPWYRQTAGKGKDKWGAYRESEEEVFEWARKPFGSDQRRTVEAEVMDWSDDIAYAVHDLEDFYRAGLVRLELLTVDERHRRSFIDNVYERRETEGNPIKADKKEMLALLARLVSTMWIREPYNGTERHRAFLRSFTGGLIDRYVQGISIRVPRGQKQRTVELNEYFKKELLLLKELTWHFVIRHSALATQQYGKARIIAELFEILFAATKGRGPMNRPSTFPWETILPVRCRQALKRAESEKEKLRLVADVISSLSDNEALVLHRRLTGAEPGSVLDITPA